VATAYGRYHYATDASAGFLVAGGIYAAVQGASRAVETPGRGRDALKLPTQALALQNKASRREICARFEIRSESLVAKKTDNQRAPERPRRNRLC